MGLHAQQYVEIKLTNLHLFCLSSFKDVEVFCDCLLIFTVCGCLIETLCIHALIFNDAQYLKGSAGTLCSVSLSANCIPVESSDVALNSVQARGH